MNFSTLKDLATKLALLAGSPSVDIAVGGKDYEVVVSRDDGDEFLGVIGFGREVEDWNRCELVLLSTRKTQ